ncbi:MAG: hypothetical protein PHV42_00780 [Candidatus Pacebacteria bacterium]|nr:hypothetical protein [Candidatus Paceibacterota bacterium]
MNKIILVIVALVVIVGGLYLYITTGTYDHQQVKTSVSPIVQTSSNTTPAGSPDYNSLNNTLVPFYPEYSADYTFTGTDGKTHEVSESLNLQQKKKVIILDVGEADATYNFQIGPNAIVCAPDMYEGSPQNRECIQEPSSTDWSQQAVQEEERLGNLLTLGYTFKSERLHSVPIGTCSVVGMSGQSYSLPASDGNGNVSFCFSDTGVLLEQKSPQGEPFGNSFVTLIQAKKVSLTSNDADFLQPYKVIEPGAGSGTN